jgi:hypothetical protein
MLVIYFPISFGVVIASICFQLAKSMLDFDGASAVMPSSFHDISDLEFQDMGQEYGKDGKHSIILNLIKVFMLF